MRCMNNMHLCSADAICKKSSSSYPSEEPGKRDGTSIFQGTRQSARPTSHFLSMQPMHLCNEGIILRLRPCDITLDFLFVCRVYPKVKNMTSRNALYLSSLSQWCYINIACQTLQAVLVQLFQYGGLQRMYER